VARQIFVQLAAIGSWESKIPLKPHLALTTNKRFCATWARPGIFNIGSLFISGYGLDRQLTIISLGFCISFHNLHCGGGGHSFEIPS
jgi:hypothetical protein